MEQLIDFYQYLDDADLFFAHLPPDTPRAEARKPETLREHMELTMHYYVKLCGRKHIDQVIKRTIAELGYAGGKLPDDIQALIYRLFVHAIYLHDPGKINPGFQKKIMKNAFFCRAKVGSSEHSIISALFYIDLFEEEISAIPDGCLKRYAYNIVYSFAYIISRHHGNLENLESFLSKLGELKGSSMLTECLKYYNRPSIWELPVEEHEQEYNSFKARKKYVDLWKLSSPVFYILNKLLFSVLITCDYYATYHYFNGEEPELGLIEDINPLLSKYQAGAIYKEIQNRKEHILQAEIPSLDMNGLRSRMFLEAEENLVQNGDANIFYLEAPTGGGKTNTSINLALKLTEKDSRLRTIFYIFPFNTLVEQTADTLENYFERDKDFAVINSITGMVEIKSDDESINYDRTYLDRQFMHYPIVATSHVNLFDALFGDSRDSNMILAKLCNSIVVIDEIQCYKNKIWRQMILMLENYSKLLNIRFIIMSATLPRLDKMLQRTIVRFVPLIEDSSVYFRNKLFKDRVKVDTSLLACGKMEVGVLIERVTDKYGKAKGKMLIELITRKTCRAVYKELVEKYGTELVVELSGDDSKLKRKAAIARIKAASDIIVVATQVIEAGVDIDMNYGFKNISLLDGEEQFMGRINRSALKPGAVAYFFMMDEPDLIYRGDLRLRLSLKHPGNEHFLADKNFGNYYEKIMGLIVEDTSAANTQNISNFTNKLRDLDFKQINEFMRLIDNRQVQVFVAHELEVNEEGSGKKMISGRTVFEQYRAICRNQGLPFAQRKVELSRLSEVMSYFIYNVETDFKRYLGELDCGFYYFEDGEALLDEESKFDRGKFIERTKGMFW